ncbi:hypothetical protein [Pseudomonas sp. HY7a-MNA-CIBAN-0227]|uniref:hypothetical protein n=1 Tax=Pseudomonas sp. HY7a-MNA-CIBAN-0227 TaxID=3140474 RepID=UPI00331ECCCA
MNKDDLLKDFMSDISHKELMKKYNLTKKEFDKFRADNNLEKEDRYILKDKIILQDCYRGFPNTYIMNKHNLTKHKFRRFIMRNERNSDWSGLTKHKGKRILELYYVAGKAICDIHAEYEADYDYAYIERFLKDAVLSKRNIEMVASYVAGATVEELVKTYKLNIQTVSKILKAKK